jgi:hypothetical protein
VSFAFAAGRLPLLLCASVHSPINQSRGSGCTLPLPPCRLSGPPCRPAPCRPQICEEEPLRVDTPPEAEPFLQPDSATDNRPFSLKHAQQQASIVGGMKAWGLLEGAAATTYVEYGAGKGYLRWGAAWFRAVRLDLVNGLGFKGRARGQRTSAWQARRCQLRRGYGSQRALCRPHALLAAVGGACRRDQPLRLRPSHRAATC